MKTARQKRIILMLALLASLAISKFRQPVQVPITPNAPAPVIARISAVVVDGQWIVRETTNIVQLPDVYHRTPENEASAQSLDLIDTSYVFRHP